MDIEGFSGQVLEAADAGFAGACGIWNQAVSRRPLAVVRCFSAADVAAAVRHARKKDLPLAVRAGGHNFAGHALVDDGLVLDLRGLRSLRIDDGRLHVGAGLRWADVDEATAPYGLAASGGSVSTVGVAGFTLGTGLGWLGRPYGLAADNLLSAQLVTADGEILEVSPEDSPELFWAIRGGCGNFGVVTRFDFRLHPMRWQPQAGMLMYPVEQAAEVIAQVIGLEVPDELSYATVLTTAPPFAGELAGRTVLMVTAVHAGPPDAGRPVMERLRAIGRPALDLIRPTPFPLFQRSTDEAAPDGLRWDVRSEWLNRPDDEAITAAVRAAVEAPSPLSEVLLRPLGGAVATGPDTAFSFRHAGFLLEVIANWADGDGTHERAWMRQTWSELSRISAGGPDVNHLGLDEGPERLRAAYSPAAFDRLVRVKRTHDPDNLFRSTQNIQP